jgi:hypothetical protein
MKPKFINAVYFEGRILLFEEYGDVYEYQPHAQRWCIISQSPWPDRRDGWQSTLTVSDAEVSRIAKSIIDKHVKRGGDQRLGQNEIEDIIRGVAI